MTTEDDIKRFEATVQRFMKAYEDELAEHQPERDTLLEKRDEIDNRLRQITEDAMREALKAV